MDLVELLLTLHNQIKVYHWQTESFAEHKAFGDTYDELTELIDEFMEVFMGRYKRIKSDSEFKISLRNHSNDCSNIIQAYIDVLRDDITKGVSDKDTDLLNLRDEMMGQLNKLKYLLTLK